MQFPKKEILHNQIVGINYQKRKDYFNFHRRKITKKGYFDGLHKQAIRTNCQKKKMPRIFIRKICPKKEILMAYVSRLWEKISKKGNCSDSL